jgi:hypothetical protein
VTGQGWVEAGDLGIGTSIVTRAGPSLTVKAVNWQRDNTGGKTGDKGAKPFTVYNLTVADDHTYFAGDLDGGLWAHNVACPRVVDMGNQGKHIFGHNNFISGRSVLTEDPNTMLSELGTGTPLRGTPGESGFRERINFNRTIGAYVDQTGTIIEPTTNAIVMYGKNGVHFVPSRP